MRNIELVASASGRAGKGPVQELSTVRDLECLAGLNIRHCVKTETPQLGLTERPDDVTNPPRRRRCGPMVSARAFGSSFRFSLVRRDFRLCDFRSQIDGFFDGSTARGGLFA
jgi:hypothetical protein